MKSSLFLLAVVTAAGVAVTAASAHPTPRPAWVPRESVQAVLKTFAPVLDATCAGNGRNWSRVVRGVTYLMYKHYSCVVTTQDESEGFAIHITSRSSFLILPIGPAGAPAAGAGRRPVPCSDAWWSSREERAPACFYRGPIRPPWSPPR